MQRGFASFVILATFILVVAAALGVYFYQNTGQKLSLPKISKTAKTSNIPATPTQSPFKDYSNPELRIEFQYLKDLTVKEDSEEEFNKRGKTNFRKNFISAVGYNPGKVLGALAVLDKTGSFEDNPFSVWVFDNPNNLTPDTWFENFWYYPYLWGVFDYVSKGHVTPDSEATVSGQAGRSKVVSYQLGEPKYIYISKDKRMYLFRIIGESGNQILPTFKFLE